MHDVDRLQELRPRRARRQNPDLSFEPESTHVALPAGGAHTLGGALAAAPMPTRAELAGGLQRTVGNAVVQRLAEPGEPPGHEPPTPVVAQRIRGAGGGASLPRNTRRRLERGLGRDLGGVRLHTDSDADSLARSIGAVAFTSGQDIFFREGAYNPRSRDGLRLLAHESTHVLQQQAGGVDGRALGGISISDPLDRFERTAARAADNVVRGQAAGIDVKPSGGPTKSATAVQRQGDFDWTKGPYGYYKNSPYAQGEPPPSTPRGFEGQPRPYVPEVPDHPTPRVPGPEPGPPAPSTLRSNPGNPPLSFGATATRFLPRLVGGLGGLASLLWSSTSIVSEEEERKMIEKSREAQARRKAEEAGVTPNTSAPEQNYTPAAPPEQNYTPAPPPEQNYTPAPPPEQSSMPPVEEQTGA